MKLTGRVDFIKVDLRSTIGAQLGDTYNIRFAGTHLLLDGTGKEIYRHRGTPDAETVIELVEAL